MPDNFEPEENAFQRAVKAVKARLDAFDRRWNESPWPGKAQAFFRNKIAAPASRKAEEWQLRDKFVRILPQDLAKSFPRTLEPLALAEWFGQALQRQGTAFYGKLVTILLCTYFLADITALLVGKYIPEPPPARMARSGMSQKRAATVEDYNIVLTRNLFNSQHLIPGEELTPGEVSPQELSGVPVKTTLPFTLLGTLILRDEIRSIATIEDSSAKTVYPVRVNDEIPSRAKILKIEPRRVIFVNMSANRREFIELPQDLTVVNPRINLPAMPSKGGGISQVSPTQFNVDKKEVDKAMGDLNNVLTQARCVPNFENGLPTGYKCFQIVPGSIYDKLGMQNGDVICGLNGQNISDPAKAFEQLSALKDASHIDLCIKRDGRQQMFSYDIH